MAKAQSLSMPHYGLGVSFVLSHLAAGARVLMLSHGVARLRCFLIGGATAAGLVAFAIISVRRLCPSCGGFAFV